MNKRISVIIPVYNAERSILNTLISLKYQNFKDYEVIIIDDGSTDDSSKICKDFSDKNLLFRYFRQNNSGVSSARNLGIKKAEGDYILFVDADDCVSENCLEKFITNLNKNSETLICGSYVMNKTRNRKINYLYNKKTISKSNYTEFYELLSHIPTAPWAKLYNKKIIDDNNITFPMDVPYGEDTIFLYTYLKYVEKIMTITDIVYIYNYLNVNSAGRKFYEDYYLYLNMQFRAKKELFYQTPISFFEEEIILFRRCIEHYILNEKNIQKCINDLMKSAKIFPNSLNDKEYGKLLLSNDYIGIIKKWKKLNFNYYLFEKIKKLFIFN